MRLLIQVDELTVKVAKYLDLSRLITDCDFVSRIVVANGGQLPVVSGLQLFFDREVFQAEVTHLFIDVYAGYRIG